MRPLHAARRRLDAPPNDSMQILQRLRAGWRPSRDNLADALVLEEWLLAPGVPYAEARTLAARARCVGLDVAACLLESAAREAEGNAGWRL